jgi:hypothetical protein
MVKMKQTNALITQSVNKSHVSFEILTAVAMKIINFLKYCSVYSRCYAVIVRLTFISDPFLGNGSVNTFPRQWLRMQRKKRGVFYAVRAKVLKRRELVQLVQLSSATEAEERWRYS